MKKRSSIEPQTALGVSAETQTTQEETKTSLRCRFRLVAANSWGA